MLLIQLMHPEYQINNKNMGQTVLANAEICNEVAEEQHGLTIKLDCFDLIKF